MMILMDMTKHWHQVAGNLTLTGRVLTHLIIPVLMVIALTVSWVFTVIAWPTAAELSPTCQAGLATLEALEVRDGSPDELLLDAVEEACGR